ncbi:hypothetical protein J4218_01495 [Candidatus Pacearchaeota archaeon]|nr:hypothetical protein [Candidatus Pacearchaeota archaeon]
MKNKIILIIFASLLISYSIAMILSETVEWPSYNFCCEKTKNDAWCQNSLESNCDTSIDELTQSSYRATPTSCDSTSYCKLGCCIDSDEGLCMENSPQRVCQISEGTWVEDAKCNVPQCTLGCCLIGDQASFSTLTRCKKISALYGLNTNFKKDIKNEADCIMTAYSQDKGACVYESDGQKTCRFITRQECLDTNRTASSNMSKTEFFKDYLCTADELAANCGPTTETMCLSGRDEVYFKDTCGNPANIYDANKVYAKDSSYWKKIVPKSASCGYKSSTANKNSATCGNCNYITGSICGKGKATYGDYICKDLNCYNTENGNSYRNGESWCVYQGEVGNGRDLVGSRHFRHVCVQGEETIEPCADFRNEVCKEEKMSSAYGNFQEAGCRINRWNDCIDQFTQEDCENFDKRDCFWNPNYFYDGSKSQNSNASVEKAEGVNESIGTGIMKTANGSNGTGICLPYYPPGLKFWSSGDAKAVCSLGNSKQIVQFTEDFFGEKTCESNCEPLNPSWVMDLNQICVSLGDCGAYSNIAGVYTDDGYVWKVNGKKQSITQGFVNGLEEYS